MLINATQKEEIRVAIVSGKTLFDLDIERTTRVQKKASIYKGRVTRVEPSLEAAFVDYGAERHGFLPIKEVARECFHPSYEGGKPHIKDILKPGQEIIVQIDKEERGNKGAALTTYIGLAGCYLVLMPNNPRAGGISRRIDGEERDEIRDILNQLPLPEGMGLIVRTAGVGRSIEELKWDLDVLLNQWQAVLHVSGERSAPFLIHRESDVIIRAIRDYLRPDITEILVDTEIAYQHALHHVQIIRPDYVDRLRRYDDAIPLFNRFQIESQIESAFKREIELENGASIVIDHTEALIAIDINSARATEGSDIEETAFQTNMAAAKEIARQLRLRDIGGLIVIDFIDMSSPKHQRLVENHLREELSADRARIQLGKISRFGLMEMSRQRLRPSLGEFSHITCPRCEGQGSVRTIQSLALSILRIVEDEAMKDNTAQVIVQAPIDLATFLVNEKRQAISDLENRHQIKIVLISNPHMVTPQYEVSRIREEEEGTQPKAQPSYHFITTPKPETDEKLLATKEEVQAEPAIKQYNASMPAPVALRDKGLIHRIWKAVFGETQSEETQRPSTERHRHHREEGRERYQQRHRRHQQRRTEGRRDGGRDTREGGRDAREGGRDIREGGRDIREGGRDIREGGRDTREGGRDTREGRGGERPSYDRGGRHQHRGRRRGGQHPRREHHHEPMTTHEEQTPHFNAPQERVTSHSEREVTTHHVEHKPTLPEVKPFVPVSAPVAKPVASEKTEAEKLADQEARKAQNTISFLKMTEQEKKAAMVTIEEPTRREAPSHEGHLKQVVTKHQQKVEQSAPPLMKMGMVKSESKEKSEKSQKESSESSTEDNHQ